MSEDKNKIIVFHKEEVKRTYSDMSLEEVLEERLLLTKLLKDVHSVRNELREHHNNLAARKRLLEAEGKG